MKMKVFLDMDEVLSDFVGAAASAWGSSRETVEEFWEPGVWGIVPPLSRAAGVDLDEEAFWSRLNGREEFWSEMPDLPWLHDVVDTVRSFCGDDWHIVTSPSRCRYCYSGKAEWVTDRRALLGPAHSRLIVGGSKTLYAGAGEPAVLIDDREETVEAFRRAGGVGIVFPRHHNILYPLKADPVSYVRGVLTALVDRGTHGGNDWSEVWRGLSTY